MNFTCLRDFEETMSHNIQEWFQKFDHVHLSHMLDDFLKKSFLSICYNIAYADFLPFLFAYQ